MKLPSKFKFKMGNAGDDGDNEIFRAVIDEPAVIISWGSGISEGCTTYQLSSVQRFVDEGTWVIQPESFDKADTFNFIEKSLLDQYTVPPISFTPIEEVVSQEPERISIQEFCKETKAVVTIFPEYFQVAVRGEVTRLSTVEDLLELIDAVRTLNRYKLV